MCDIDFVMLKNTTFLIKTYTVVNDLNDQCIYMNPVQALNKFCLDFGILSYSSSYHIHGKESVNSHLCLYIMVFNQIFVGHRMIVVYIYTFTIIKTVII